MNLTVLRFALTAFLGSFLSFAIQPMAGKALLPVFGGSFMVWAATLCFFQFALLIGYAVAHALFARRVTLARCLSWLLLLVAAVLLLPPTPAPLRSEQLLSNSPGLDIVRRLASGFGAAAVALFAGSIMLQRFWRCTPGSAGREPLIYYAASNVGSLGALLGYLFLLEPLLPLASQEALIRVLFPLWIICFASCIPLNPTEELDPALLLASAPASDTPPPPPGSSEKPAPKAAAPTFADAGNGVQAPDDADVPSIAIAAPAARSEVSALALFLQAGAGSALLASTTTLLTLDVSPMPFLWVAPLTLYLLTFIRVFGNIESALQAAEHRFVPALALGFSLALIHQLNFALGILPRLALHLWVLYYLCLACHSRFLTAGPPAPHQLTRFYLFIAAGGAVGTLSMNLLAAVVFDRFQEFNLCLLLATLVWRGTARPAGFTPTIEMPNRLRALLDPGDPFFLIRATALVTLFLVFPTIVNQGMPITSSFLPPVAAGAMVYGWLALRTAERLGGREAVIALIMAVCIMLLPDIGAPGTDRLTRRTWYGMYRVYDQGDIRFLQMGSTFHGGVWLDPARHGKPCLYYHPETTIGRFFSQPDPLWKSAAVIGLGAGMLAAYTRPGQELTYLELDPAQVDIARTWFPYLASAPGSIRIETGDGRLLLRHATRTFDLIVFDAFSSDSIPTHLLTIESIEEAIHKLASPGVILYNISNRHLNLLPILHANAEALHLSMLVSRNHESDELYRLPTRWVVLGSPAALEHFFGAAADWRPLPKKPRSCAPWSDDFVNPWVPLLSFDLLDDLDPPGSEKQKPAL